MYCAMFKLRNVVGDRLVHRGVAILQGRYTDN